MTPQDALRLLTATTTRWVGDPESDVVWAGEHDGLWGIRMAQRVRDFTTVWFDVGERTVGFETYLLPDPPHGHEAVYRMSLRRNWSSWPVAIAMDRSSDLYVKGRIPLSVLDEEAIDGAVGAVYELVELTFRTLVDVGFRKPVRER
ncbi:MAG: hypothetical protein EHM57_04785 [Actinobacteria bacterium]|nr:MAG: hypothetical protein EHM57_04785 [Actinomycetota bacterium]